MDNKRLSKKREIQAAKDIGGKAHINSGAMWFCKNDMSDEIWSCEDKFTFDIKYSIKYSIINKLEKHALKINKLPMLRFGFEKENKNYALVEKKHLKEYLLDIDNILLFKTTKNSILFKLKDLMQLANINNILCEIFFEKYNKNYIIITWEYFVEIHNLR